MLLRSHKWLIIHSGETDSDGGQAEHAVHGGHHHGGEKDLNSVPNHSSQDLEKVRLYRFDRCRFVHYAKGLWEERSRECVLVTFDPEKQVLEFVCLGNRRLDQYTPIF